MWCNRIVKLLATARGRSAEQASNERRIGVTLLEIIRTWVDAEYRLSLSMEQEVQLRPYPTGLIELTDAELELVVGGEQQLVLEQKIWLPPNF
jgi:mersacidin/lichenicidin family type 2 lantibiotic